MIRNYLLIALRNMRRAAGYTAINVLGLALGIATSVLMLLFVRDELSYDAWHTKKDRIYRVIRETNAGGRIENNDQTSGALPAALKAEFPEVEKAARVWPWFAEAKIDGKKQEIQICVADPEMFEIFDFPFVTGSHETAFPNPNSIAITESAARRFFGDANPIGKTLSVESTHHGGEKIVTAVLKDVPRAASFSFDYVVTEVFSENGRVGWEEWRATDGWRPAQSFFLLREGADLEALLAKMPAFIERHMGAEIAKTNAYHFQPLTRIYLYTRHDYDIDWYGDINRVYQFAAIAFLVLAIGCINFANLTTARSARRAREVGLRKVSGAFRFQLIGQFLGESLLTTYVSTVLAAGIVYLVLPEFNAFFDKRLELGRLSDGYTLLGIATLVGLVSGVYPAVYLSALEPSDTLKGTFKAGARGQWLRKTLVVMQFAISITLIVGTGVVYQQLEYIRNKNLGFNTEHLVLMPIFWQDQEVLQDPSRRLAHRYETVKRAFLDHPGVTEATAYRWWMGWGGGITRTVRAEGHESVDWRMPILEVDKDYIPVFDISVVEGRNFDPQTFATDTASAFILNKTAVRTLGWDDPDSGGPIGKRFEWLDRDRNRRGVVIGVVEDFHYTPLRERIGPVALIHRHQQFYNLAVRVRPDMMDDAVAHFEKTWSLFLSADHPFEYRFFDQDVAFMYEEENRVQRLTLLSSGIAIFLACIGLFALASFSTEERRKEIGVRKTLGATITGIVIMVSREFAILVAVAAVLSLPLAWIAMQHWLDNFAYRTGLGPLPFVFGALLTLAIAQTTVTWHAVRAARADPVDALRDE